MKGWGRLSWICYCLPPSHVTGHGHQVMWQDDLTSRSTASQRESSRSHVPGATLPPISQLQLTVLWGSVATTLSDCRVFLDIGRVGIPGQPLHSPFQGGLDFLK